MNKTSSKNPSNRKDSSRPQPKRALVKISGEGFARSEPLSKEAIDYLISQLDEAIKKTGAEIGVVVGGGNIIRGARQNLLKRKIADLAGMVGTIINGLVLQANLASVGYEVLLQSALPLERVTEPINPNRAVECMEGGGVAVFAGGTGNPFFTTDSAAALRAGEVEADLIVKGTQVKGVYSSDPETDEQACFLRELSFQQLFDQNLTVIDPAAAKICQETEIPMVVFDFHQPGALTKVLLGEEIGSIVYPG